MNLLHQNLLAVQGCFFRRGSKRAPSDPQHNEVGVTAVVAMRRGRGFGRAGHEALEETFTQGPFEAACEPLGMPCVGPDLPRWRP